MRDFSEYNKDINSKFISDGERIFQKQLNSVEGVNIFVNGKAERGIIYNHLNDMSEREYRALNFSLDTDIKTGDYVGYNGENWIVITDIDNHYVYKNCKIQKCNQMLRKSDWIIGENYISIPCNISNDSHGSKTNLNNDFIAETDTKAKIAAQYNEYTKSIKKDDRFMFNNNENDIFKVIDISTSMQHGTITLICKKDLYKPEYDNLENNIAWNGVIDEKPTDYSIVGDDEIKVNNTYTYTLSPNVGNTTWKLDDFSIDNDIAEINVIDDYTVSVVGKVVGGFIELICEVDGILVSKEIMIVR